MLFRPRLAHNDDLRACRRPPAKSHGSKYHGDVKCGMVQTNSSNASYSLSQTAGGAAAVVAGAPGSGGCSGPRFRWLGVFAPKCYSRDGMFVSRICNFISRKHKQLHSWDDWLLHAAVVHQMVRLSISATLQDRYR